MSDLLLIVGPEDTDAKLLHEVARRHPARVTVLVREGDESWASDDSGAGEAIRDRLARLMGAIERDTGATVVGLAGGEEQLLGWRFDRVIDTAGDPAPLIAA
jgi:hypothetical protein